MAGTLQELLTPTEDVSAGRIQWYPGVWALIVVGVYVFTMEYQDNGIPFIFARWQSMDLDRLLDQVLIVAEKKHVEITLSYISKQ